MNALPPNEVVSNYEVKYIDTEENGMIKETSIGRGLTALSCGIKENW
jgi:hypothetical protein